MKLARLILGLLIAFAVGLFVGGRLHVRHIGPAEFVDRERLAGTVQDADFIGVAHGKAYLSDWTLWPVVGARIRVLWTEADGLPPEALREMEERRGR